MRRGQTKYTEVGGVPELRAAVCAKFKRDNGLDYEPADVLVSCGAKHTLFNIVVALLNPGDEVLVPSPYWVSYPEQVRLVGGVAGRRCRPREATRLRPRSRARCAAAVTPRTKLIVLNSPNNPTGAVFSRAALEAVARLAVERDLWVVSDECYEALTFEGRHVSIASFGPEIKARTIVVNTCSKAYAMTGWRIGYAAGPRDADPRHDRRAEPGDVEPVVDRAVGRGGGARPARRTRSRRWRASSTGAGGSSSTGSTRCPACRCVMPKGAFYAFANVSGLFGRTWRRTRAPSR